MTSRYYNRLEKEVGFEKQPSEKWKTELKQKATTGNRGTEAAYPSLYESLLSQEVQKQEPFFNRLMYLRSILLVLIFLTAAASLALNLSQLNLPSGMLS